MSSKQTLTSRTRFSILILLILIVALGGLLRFYGLTWGDGLFFHPDENNMARAISQLNPSTGFHPDFFAYGQLPLYLVYFSYQLVHGLDLRQVPFKEAIYFLRFWSALFSTLTIPLVYLISRKLFTAYYSLLSATLVAFMPGLIQAAHFGTTESLLTFFFMLIIYLTLHLGPGPKYRSILMGIVFGLAVGTKASALYFIAPVIVASLYVARDWKKFIYFWLIFTVFAVLVALLASPYNLVDYESYLSSMRYESAVAFGDVKVFYTRQFENSVPLVFQAIRVFPFAVGFITSIFGLFGLLLSLREYRKQFFVILIFSFLFIIAVNSLIFAKWTRFMTPAYPLFAVFTAYALYKLQNKLAIMLILFLSIAQGALLFQLYIQPDTRIAASTWINENIPAESYVLSETANVVDIPVRNENELTVISFDFYHLDQEPELPEALISHLEKADYIFIPSRRLYANLPQNAGSYPILEKYYETLFSGHLGFELIHTQQPYSNPEGWSKIEEIWAEETFTVFDHPTIRVYKKVDVLE